jgi:FkbM family methyltransferase
MRPRNGLHLPYVIDSLPLFARLYRNAFRSGSGNRRTGWQRSLCRLLYYLYGWCNPRPAYGQVTMNIRGRETVIRFDAKNRQFSALYFDRYLEEGYEPEVTSAIRELVPRAGVFYDVGSNWGYYALLVAADAAFQGRVHAFEPWPASYRDLTETVRQAGLEDVIRCHAYALGDCVRTVTMRCGRHSGLARVVRTERGVPVGQQTLDALAFDPPDLIKLDAEGAELAILQGAVALLRRSHPILVFEHAGDGSPAQAGEVLAFLEAQGYRLYVPLVEYAAADGRVASCASGANAPPPGFAPSRLELLPIAARQRCVFPRYLNLLACHPQRAAGLESYLADRRHRPVAA